MSGVCSAHQGHVVGCAQCEAGMSVANEDARGLLSGWGGTISASLVWDGTDEVRIPACMGTPREDQMQGTALERLIELAGRISYDSLGKGRASADYHKHILDVGHLSVCEHAVKTVEFEMQEPYAYEGDKGPEVGQLENQSWFWETIARNCTNKPSIYMGLSSPPRKFRMTLNVRHACEWHTPYGINMSVGTFLQNLFGEVAPAYKSGKFFGLHSYIHYDKVRFVEPQMDEEKWISLYVSGSRGFSHELVRHGDWTAISQRSTRYVDENESEWVLHPLLAEFLSDQSVVNGKPDDMGMHASSVQTFCSSVEGQIRRILDNDHGYAKLLAKLVEEVKDYGAWWSDVRRHATMSAQEAKIAYGRIVRALEAWLLPRLQAKGDPYAKTSARKQARGAARGILGNALETEMIFSASVKQWRHVLTMRAADAADAEIRCLFAEAVLPELRKSRYADRFADLELQQATDGIGRSLKGGGAR